MPENFSQTSKQAITKEVSDKISFVTYIVPEFADAYKMPVPAAFKYLKKYGGWDFLNKYWRALHTDNPFNVVDYLYRVCLQNGGLR